MPGSRGNAAALYIILVHQKLYEEGKRIPEDKIKFIVDLNLHNNENKQILEEFVSPVGDDIIVLETKPKLDESNLDKCQNNKKLTDKKICIAQRWGDHVGWRTQTIR